MIYLGLDGGGTKTRVVVQRDDLEPRYFERPVSLKVRDGDFDGVAERFRALVREAIGQSRDTLSISMGLSGMSREQDQNALRQKIFSDAAFSNAIVRIESDATLTLKTVLGEGDEGILMLSGTGSAVFYQPSGGPPRRIGGWGHVLSDEGSGYRIGLRALQHYVQVMDAVYRPDAFSQAVEARLVGHAMSNPSQMELGERASHDPTFVASFAQDAFEAAPENAVVFDFVQHELMQLVTLLFPLIFSPVMSGKKPYPLYLAGRIAQQKMMIQTIEVVFADDYSGMLPVELHLIDEHAPAYKALEFARGLV